MKLHRFFVPPQCLGGRMAKLTDPAQAAQIVKVLRLRAGDEILLLDGDGFEYIARIAKVSAKEVQAEILKRQLNKNEAELKITLYQSLLKKDKLEWVFQKCTEAGVAAFVPLKSAWSEKLGLNADRAKKIITEAAEQSERGIVPELSEPQEFARALRRAAESRMPVFVLDPSGEPLAQSRMARAQFAAHIFVGPEGGWNEDELSFARELSRAGYAIEIASIGPRILRPETAGIVAVTILLHITK